MTRIGVIGGGIAGIQAGIFTAKAGEETKVFDTGESLVKNTSNIQNLLGHDSVGGQELLKRGKEKLGNFNGEFVEAEVVNVERDGEELVIQTEENEDTFDFVIVASAGNLEFVEDLVDFEDGVEGPYMMERHVVTDDSNKAADGIYAAGLANSWEYQTATAIGDGARAAVNLLTEVNGEPYEDHDT